MTVEVVQPVTTPAPEAVAQADALECDEVVVFYGTAGLACDAATGRVVATGGLARFSPFGAVACRDLGPSTCAAPQPANNAHVDAHYKSIFGKLGHRRRLHAAKGKKFFIPTLAFFSAFGGVQAQPAAYGAVVGGASGSSSAYAQCKWIACKPKKTAVAAAAATAMPMMATKSFGGGSAYGVSVSGGGGSGTAATVYGAGSGAAQMVSVSAPGASVSVAAPAAPAMAAPAAPVGGATMPVATQSAAPAAAAKSAAESADLVEDGAAADAVDDAAA